MKKTSNAKGKHWKIGDTSLMRIAAKERMRNPELRNKISQTMKGRPKPPRTLEHSKKISETHKRLGIMPPSRKGTKLTEEQKSRISKSNKGKHYYWLGREFSEEHKRKIGKGNKGKRCTEETIIKMRKSAIERGILPPLHKGKDCHWYNGGRSFEPYTIDWTDTLKRSIRERDKYICQICGKTQIEELEEVERKLPIHHINYDKKNCNPDNLITLCHKCHPKTNNNRSYWIKYFKEKLDK